MPSSRHRDVLRRHAAGGRVLAELEELRDFVPLLRLHLLENLAGVSSGRSPSRSAAASGSISSTMSAARSLSSDSTIDTWTFGIEFLERLGGDFLVDRLEHGFALGRRQIFDDVRDVGRVELREPFVDDLQLDAARRIGLEQIDVLPRDDARRNLLEQRAQRERGHDALAQAADGAARADVDGDDVQRDVAVDRRRVELDVVDADDLAAVDVDDLLIEQIALEQQHAVRRVYLSQRDGVVAGADGGAARFERDGGSMRSPSGVLTIRNAMRVGWSCGATAISRTRPRTVPVASRTVAPSSSDRATRDIGGPAFA